MPNFPRNMIVTKSEISQTFDLEEMFGADISDNERLKEEIGQEIIDIIKNRTLESNKDIWGVKFENYSSEYVSSDTFEDFDKSRSDINMQLTGKMLESLEVEIKNNEIRLFLDDSSQIPKAFNHQTGDRLKQRAWFGLSEDGMDKLVGIFQDEIDSLKSEEGTDRATADRARQTALDLLNGAGVVQENAEDLFATLVDAAFPDLTLGGIV